MNSLTNVLNQIGNSYFLNAIRIPDIVDVLIVAVFLYTVFILFKQTRSYLIMVGLVLMGGLFLAARIFNLYLTSIALQSVFSFLVVILVVIFQSEFRRFFEYIALLGTRSVKRKPRLSDNSEIPAIVQAVSQMARDKIGALLVIQGVDDLSRFSQGGKTLDGIVTEEMLESIFEPNSVTHDGAIIILKNRITQFSCHLPLSTNFKEIGKHGTRHSAGLGIAERTDALAVIVSEEKGTISLARDSRLKVVESAQDLEKELLKFTRDKHGKNSTTNFKHLITGNAGLKFLSLAIALALWLSLSARTETISRDYYLPVTITNLPETVLIEDSSPKTITVTLEGRGEVAFSGLEQDSLEIVLDGENLKNGLNALNIAKPNVKHPINLNLTNIQPSTIYLLANRYKPVTSNVQAKIVNSPANTNLSITVTPSQLTYLIPENQPALDVLFTENIDLKQFADSQITETQAVLPANAKLIKEGDQQVTVAISSQ